MSTWMMSPSPTTASLKIRRFNSSMVLPSVQCTVSMLLNMIINYFTRPCNIDKRTKIGYSNQSGDCGFVTLPAHSQLQRYPSGHNGADSKSCFHFESPNCRKASNHAGLRASSNRELGSVLSCCSSQFPRLEFCGKMAIMRAAI